MHILNTKDTNRMKPRGLKRKCNCMVNRIMSLTKEFPCEDYEGCGYWHTHLPVAQTFIDSKNTPKSVRKLCIQTLINATTKLYDKKLHFSDEKIRIVLSINLPELWDSTVTIFFGDDYFSTFFNRDSDEQKWSPLPSQRNLGNEWGLNIPKQFAVKGYKEEIHDEDYNHIGEIWFIGELA